MTVEKHVRYNTDVETLTDAWTFILSHVDEFTAPTIGIEAFSRTSYSLTGDAEDNATIGYTASIHGYVNA